MSVHVTGKSKQVSGQSLPGDPPQAIFHGFGKDFGRIEKLPGKDRDPAILSAPFP